jgi:ADP-dependent NAD(P)H-hydrate dehydratase / NAD(P)H-hydrate epimerase
MNVYRTQDIRTIDRLFMEKTGETEKQLITRAARAFVQAFLQQEKAPGNVLVVAGPGNNGADARSIAQLLKENGWRIQLMDFAGPLAESEQDGIWQGVLSGFKRDTIVIDGLFGSGLTRPVTGRYGRIIEGINNLNTKVYAVDIPSGLPGEGLPDPSGAIVRASVTYAFQFPKFSFFFAEAYPYTGEWKVLDIGMGSMEYPGVECSFVMTSREYFDEHFPGKRHPFSYKNNFGHALLIAGSRGKMGAALLAARSCLRTGAGLLTVHIPSAVEGAFYASLPEAMLSVDTRTDVTGDLPGGLAHGKTAFSAIGAGPGMGTASETSGLMGQLLGMLNEMKPAPSLVLDADALNTISANPMMMSLIPAGTVITPHPGEFDRLVAAWGWSKATNGQERAMQAVKMAREKNIVVVLKGRYTLTTTPEGPHWFNPTGNPGMATAGSGDVLTGIILALLARGYKPSIAAVVGAYLHGKAGDKALSSGLHTFLMAGDLIKNL